MLATDGRGCVCRAVDAQMRKLHSLLQQAGLGSSSAEVQDYLKLVTINSRDGADSDSDEEDGVDVNANAQKAAAKLLSLSSSLSVDEEQITSQRSLEGASREESIQDSQRVRPWLAMGCLAAQFAQLMATLSLDGPATVS